MSAQSEMDAISEMIVEAEKSRLLCEVIRSMWIASKSGCQDIETACEIAMQEWDI